MKLQEKVLDFILCLLSFFERRIILLALILLSLSYGVKATSVSSHPLFLTTPETLEPLAKIPYATNPNRNSLFEFPALTAQSILVADLNTTRILYQKNMDLVLAPASTTKLMTALVSLDLYNLERLLPTPEKCLALEGNKLSLSPAEALSVTDLLHALLISSSNDVACILANNATSEAEFVELMNQKALEIGMSETHFTNPVGFDSDDFAHTSSAKDLYILALQAKSNPIINEIYSKPQYTLTSGDYPRTVLSTNRLLTQLKGSIGMKTGTTTQAGEVFIYEYADEDKDLLIILMGSEARFYEAEAILNWLNTSYIWL
jgi:D-alanyl-D-alanine carboxypeptidase